MVLDSSGTCDGERRMAVGNSMEIADDLGHRSWRLLPYGRYFSGMISTMPFLVYSEVGLPELTVREGMMLSCPHASSRVGDPTADGRRVYPANLGLHARCSVVCVRPRAGASDLRAGLCDAGPTVSPSVVAAPVSRHVGAAFRPLDPHGQEGNWAA